MGSTPVDATSPAAAELTSKADETPAPDAKINPGFVISTSRMHLVCPPDLTVNQAEFMTAVAAEAESLCLPMTFQLKTVGWEKIDLNEELIVVQPATENRISLLAKLEYIGRVAFITQRTYLVPFQPPVIKTPTPVWAIVLLGVGMLLAIVAVPARRWELLMLGGLLVFISILLFILNAGAAPAAHARAQSAWVDSVSALFVRATVTNETAALSTTLEEAVRAAVDKLFVQRGAQLEAADREKKTQAELEEEVQKQYEKFMGRKASVGQRSFAGTRQIRTTGVTRGLPH